MLQVSTISFLKLPFDFQLINFLNILAYMY